MTKNSKRKPLFMTLLLMLLVVSSAYAALIPGVNGAEVTNQEKGLSILNNVVGLDLSRYTVTAEEAQTDSTASYLGVIPQENVEYDLTSEGNKLNALYTFANGKLQMIQVLENEGSPHTTLSVSSARELAQGFLSNYQTYTKDSVYGELRSTLDNVDASKNATKTSGNTQLEVSAIDGYTTFKWTYTFNGVIAPSKFVALGFNNSFLTAFVDYWQLYKIGSTRVRLSEKEAAAIALETAKDYSWSLKLEDDALDAENFNESNVRWTSLIFDNSLEAGKARSEDRLELYPVWRMGIALNKWYGQMYGIQVDIWADTGEVRCVQEAWSTMPPPEGVPTADMDSHASDVSEAKPSLAMVMAFPTLALAATVAFVWLGRRKKARYYSLLRPRAIKAGGILLCVLIFSIILSSIATVNATRAGVVWGSESTGAYDPNIPGSWKYWRKNQTEINLQRYISDNIENYFDSNGYDGYNRQGYSGSLKNNILSYITYTKENYDGTAVVAFDHGVGNTAYSQAPNEWHYMFEDNVGTLIGARWGTPQPDNGVYDMDIYPLTNSREIFFAFINTCLSANTSDWQVDKYGTWWYSAQGMGVYGARGLPFAFTHRYVKERYAPGFNEAIHISNYGYHYPDSGPHVYIGFPWGSPSLQQHIPKDTGIQYQHWVNSFFYYALFYDMSVNDALDHASWQHWGAYFGNSPLWTGYQAYWWPDWYPYADSKMAVYGNGNIHLKTYVPLDFVTTPSVSGPTSGDIGISYQFSASSTDSYGHNLRYTFDWGDGSPQTVTGWYSSGATAYASHSWSSAGQFSVKVKAQCEGGVWSSWSNPYTVRIGAFHWLHVDAYCYPFGYDADPWVSIDGDEVGTAPVSVLVEEGWHTVTVPYQWGYWPLTGFSDGYGNGESRPIYSDTDITAYYG
jgi:hypothetical protein